MRKADNLPPSCVVTKSGNLNFLEPSGPVQACNGTDLPLLSYMRSVVDRNVVMRLIPVSMTSRRPHTIPYCLRMTQLLSNARLAVPGQLRMVQTIQFKFRICNHHVLTATSDAGPFLKVTSVFFRILNDIRQRTG